MAAAGRGPSTAIAQREYWPVIAAHAAATRDKKLLSKAIKAAQKVYGKGIDEEWVKEMEGALKKL